LRFVEAGTRAVAVSEAEAQAQAVAVSEAEAQAEAVVHEQLTCANTDMTNIKKGMNGRKTLQSKTSIARSPFSQNVGKWSEGYWTSSMEIGSVTPALSAPAAASAPRANNTNAIDRSKPMAGTFNKTTAA
jgi:hypothetical protein